MSAQIDPRLQTLEANLVLGIQVDEEDQWLLLETPYTLLVRSTDIKVYRVVNTKASYLHREIMKPPPELVVDHINGNGLDNRKKNLRICTQAQNVRNRAPIKGRYKGVSSRGGGVWRARITVDGRMIYLGDHLSEIAAAKAYDQAAIRFHGEFARLNFYGS